MAEKYTVAQAITTFFIKYNQLDKIIAASKINQACQEINLFIDLNSILNKLYFDDISVSPSDFTTITSHVMNMCAHYKLFFHGRGIATNVYLIYGLNRPQETVALFPDYNGKFSKLHLQKLHHTVSIESNLKFIDIICKSLKNTHFFDIGMCEVCSMVDYLIQKTMNAEKCVENIILSKDPLMLQLVAIHGAHVLHPVKSSQGDQSFIVDTSNLWNNYIMNYRHTACIVTPPDIHFFPNVMAMTSIPERNLFSILKIGTAFKFIKDAVEKKLLDENTFYTQAGVNAALVAAKCEMNQDSLPMIENRFNAINPVYQSKFVLQQNYPALLNNIATQTKIDDAASLREIFMKYFSSSPIELDRLLL